MVKNRGIEISVISQFDIQRLPEFQGPLPTTEDRNGGIKDNLVTCFIPVYPGSQIWFEYNIEPPHPPKAIYFFKLLINQQVVTSWDCTEKQGYHGKAMYGLQRVPANGQDTTELHQRGFQFCNRDESDSADEESDDCIEIRVHRVEHRQRVRDARVCADDTNCRDSAGPLRFIDRGPLGPGRPQRRYKYQLLDPIDEPFAIFQLFYRSYGFLKENNIIQVSRTSLSSAAPSSTSSSRTNSCSSTNQLVDRARTIQPLHIGEKVASGPSTPPKKSISQVSNRTKSSPPQVQRASFNSYLPLSDSSESLNNIIKDSIEDLPSTVPRSPQSPRSNSFSLRGGSHQLKLPAPEPSSPRPKHKNKFSRAVCADRPENEGARRPLSPFTSGGVLRRMMSSRPHSSTTWAHDRRNPSRDQTRGAAAWGKEENNDTNLTAPQTMEKVGTAKALINMLGRRIGRNQ